MPQADFLFFFCEQNMTLEALFALVVCSIQNNAEPHIPQKVGAPCVLHYFSFPRTTTMTHKASESRSLALFVRLLLLSPQRVLIFDNNPLKGILYIKFIISYTAGAEPTLVIYAAGAYPFIVKQGLVAE